MNKKRKYCESISDSLKKNEDIYETFKENMIVMIQQLKSIDQDDGLLNFLEKYKNTNQKSWKENIYDILFDLQSEKKINYYLNFENIFNDIDDLIKNKDFEDSVKMLDDIIEIIEENHEEFINRCLICGEDMGRTNPRQLCGKTFCENL